MSKAIALVRWDYSAYIDLGWYYMDQKKYAQVEELFKKTFEIDPRKDIAYGALGVFYNEIGKYELSE